MCSSRAPRSEGSRKPSTRHASSSSAQGSPSEIFAALEQGRPRTRPVYLLFCPLPSLPPRAVILSGASAKRSEALAQSKDPYLRQSRGDLLGRFFSTARCDI